MGWGGSGGDPVRQILRRGAEPCDDLEACCRHHDSRVENKGLMSIKCHEKFKMHEESEEGQEGRLLQEMPIRASYGDDDSGAGHGDHAQPVGQPEVGAIALSMERYSPHASHG